MSKPICPECEQGKCGNCDGSARNGAADDIDECYCPSPLHARGPEVIA